MLWLRFFLHLFFLSYLWCSLHSPRRKGVFSSAVGIQHAFECRTSSNFARNLSFLLCMLLWFHQTPLLLFVQDNFAFTRCLSCLLYISNSHIADLTISACLPVSCLGSWATNPLLPVENTPSGFMLLQGAFFWVRGRQMQVLSAFTDGWNRPLL